MIGRRLLFVRRYRRALVRRRRELLGAAVELRAARSAADRGLDQRTVTTDQAAEVLRDAILQAYRGGPADPATSRAIAQAEELLLDHAAQPRKDPHAPQD